MDKEKVLAAIKDFESKYDVDINDVIDLLYKEKQAKKEKKVKQLVESRRDMVGKCFKKRMKPIMFPEMYKYYKIVSERGENDYRFSVLTFYEHPYYWFDYQSHMIELSGNYYFGEFDFDSFTVESMMHNSFDKTEEISSEEFADAMRKYTEELIELPWYADHYRFGNKLPTDEGWPDYGK